MRNFRKLTAILFVIALAVALFGSFQVFAVTAQIPYTEPTTLLSGGVTEEDGDIDVPFQPTKTVRSISIQTKPSKLTYHKGEALDLTGLVVKAYYSNGSSAVVTNYHVSGYNANLLGQQTITISLSGKTATFKVTVINPIVVGDATGDGSVDGNDATLLLQFAAGWPVEINEASADANGDGLVDGNDATLLLQFAAGWPVILGSQ